MELKELREEINAIDAQIEDLFQKRMDVSAKIADYKASLAASVDERDARLKKKIAEMD